MALWITPQFLSQRTLWWDRKQMTNDWVKARREGGKGEEGEDAERRGEGGQNHGCIVVYFPTVNSRGSGTEQLNIQTGQWGSEHGAAVEHGCHQVQGCETLMTAFFNYTGRAAWEYTLLFRYSPMSRQSTGSHTVIHLGASQYNQNLSGLGWSYQQLHVLAHKLQVIFTLHYCPPLVDPEGQGWKN